jgi:hypothetical protein
MAKKQNKEVTVKEANEKAAKKSEADCKAGIMDEALKLYRKETHSVQQMLAYARQLDKMGKLPKQDEDKK